MTLASLIATLRDARGIALKREIGRVAELLPQRAEAVWLPEGARAILNGDDAAAIPDGDGYILLAAEGMLPAFVAADPWFAGFCAVMVNVSDILAMGGRPYAVVDVLFAAAALDTAPLFAGMTAAARAFGVPVVGGHTSPTGGGAHALAAAIVGRARRLITSFAAQPGDVLVAAVDLRGAYRARTSYFDAATSAPVARLRGAANVLPELADAGRVRAGKDVSMAGFAGTLAMLCEASGVGATLELDALPRPGDAALAQWLTTFPSFGFLLAVEPAEVTAVHAACAAAGVASATVGRFDDTRRVELALGGERATFWDFAREPLTGFGPP